MAVGIGEWLVSNLELVRRLVGCFSHHLTASSPPCLLSVLASVMHVLTRDEEELPALDLGTSIALGPAVLSLAGFFMGVIWIDMLASEVPGD